MEKTAKPRYIPTEPLGTDLYEGTPQQRVANAIAAVLRGEQFKLIGLDGAWGAGKSNVIGILKSLLKDTHHFFIYDAWSHQEDLQRRAFLEEFTSDLVKNKVINGEAWQADLNDLLAKKRSTITKTIPSFNPAYYALIGTLLLFYVSKPVSEMVNSERPWLRLTIQLAPAILLLVTWAIAAFYSPAFRNIQNMLAIYKEKELEKETSEIVSEKEPSVQQFRDWMTKVSAALNNKKVVVVFDNMDRLPADKVKALWSAIQTFLSEAKDHYPQISFIIPFDRLHIGKAFGGKEEEGDGIAAHFINKTFPVIFNVALPSLTGWKGLFKIKMSDAFGEIPPTEYEQIESIFDLYNDIITPRNIISFINDLVTLKLIWEDQIAIRYIALFVAARKEIMINPLDQILKRAFVAKAEIFFKGDDDLPKVIAALVYNVSIDKASQVSLYREIQLSFRSRNMERIKEMYLHPDFLAVLKKMIPGSDLSIEDYVMVLAALENNTDIDGIKLKLQPFWPLLAGKQTVQPIPVLHFDVHYGVLLDKVIGHEKLWPLVTHFVNEFYSNPSTDGAAYYESFLGLEEVLKRHQLETRLLPYLKNKTVNADFFLSYVDAGREQYRKYKVSTDAFALDHLLVNKVSTEFDHYPAIAFFAPDYALPAFTKRLEDYLSSDVQPINLYPAVFCYKYVCRDQPVKILLSNETLSALLSRQDLGEKLTTELLAMKLARSKAGEPPLLAINSLGREEQDKVVEAVALTVETYKRLDELIKDELLTNDPLAKLVLRQRILFPSSASATQVPDLLKAFFSIQQHFEITNEGLFGALNTWYKPGSGLPAVKALPDYVPDQQLLTLAFQQSDNPFARDLLSLAKEYTAIAEAADWDHAFAGGSDYLFRLTMLLLSNGSLEKLPVKAYASFKKALERIARGEQGIADATSWHLLYERADTTQLAPALLDIRDQFINEHTITAELLVFFEPLLRDQGDLYKRSDDVIRTILQPLISYSQAIECIQPNRHFYLALLQKGQESITGNFIRLIRDAVENGQASGPLTEFSRYLDQNLYGLIEILQADYRSINHPDKSIDVTELLKQKVLQEHVLHFRVTNESMGGDPDFGTTKKLSVNLKYRGKENTLEWNENEFYRLPNG